MKKSLTVLISLIIVYSAFSQSKKQQIETLTFQMDSLQRVISKERGITKEKVSALEEDISILRQEMVGVQKELTQTKIALLEQEKASINKQLAFDERERNLLDSISFLEKQLRVLKFNSYESVTIGNQVWMTKNLNVDKFRNGEPIPNAKTVEEWEKAGENGQPAWCYYDNNPANGEKYGKLYNWYAVNDPRGLAPEGWKVPSCGDWEDLREFLGDDGDHDAVAGPKMKSVEGWKDNGNGTNESGFSGLPGGSRNHDGSFDIIGENGIWWGHMNCTIGLTKRHGIAYIASAHYWNNKTKYSGVSVRCIKD